PARTHRVQTPEQLAEAMQLVEVARLRRAAATAREQGEAKAGVFEQGLAVVQQRRHYRHLAVRQFGGELVFLQNRRIAPARRAIELGDQGLAVFDANLVDAVLVAVEGQYPRVADEADALHGVQHQI